MPGHSTEGASATSHATSSAPTASSNSTSKAMALAGDAGFNNISSLADLKKKSPQLYKYMMISIAQNICIQIKRQQDRLTEEWKKFREKS
jgi:hypothetical protein